LEAIRNHQSCKGYALNIMNASYGPEEATLAAISGIASSRFFALQTSSWNCDSKSLRYSAPAEDGYVKARTLGFMDCEGDIADRKKTVVRAKRTILKI
jgi:hypothetical protein